MSRAIASARQRRAGIQPQEQPAPPTPSNSAPAGLTLQQVIALVDTRLIKLEKFMKETQESPVQRTVTFAQEPQVSGAETEEVDGPTNLEQILGEYNDRFMLLAEEIAELKDTLMKLQTYTMDVNKMLLEERVNVLSDLGSSDKNVFVMDDTTLSGGDIEQPTV
jgi:hypothetical protein